MSVELNGIERMTRVLLRLGIMPSDVMFDGVEIITASAGSLTTVVLKIKLAPAAAERVLEAMTDVEA